MTQRSVTVLLRRLIVCFYGGLALSGWAADPAPPPASFAIAEAPAWVRAFTPEPAPSAEAVDGGISYVLVDQQENLEPRASYYHEARQITSENGVQNGAAITASFDPSYQKLTFHAIRLMRQGAATDRLDRSRIKLYQREREMESFLYDGAFTAQCQIEDVRVGDTIEYAYTIEGANPVLKGKYFDSFPTEWATPVRHAITRIVHPSGRKLNFLTKNRTIQPVISTEGGTTEWLWDEKGIRGHQMDPNTPRGYYPFGIVQISEFADWQQVVDWAVALYQIDTPPTAELGKETARLRAIADPEERILAALRFVQEEIRYLGIESGVGSHQPTAPDEVLRRRFGDCKDKTLLLATLLEQSGVTATPALVSTVHRARLADRIPSPGSLNHVILQVVSGNNTHWLDATRSYQRGPLSQIYIGNFAWALVLRPGTKELTAYAPPRDSLPNKKLVEKFRIPAPGGNAHLEVTSEYRGLSADMTRSFFQSTTKENIQKDYLQYYARRYPQIQIAQPVAYQELPGGIGCQVKESYLIPGIWQLNDEKTQYKLILYPTDVDQEMGTPGPARRTDPLAINHPVRISQEIHAEMFENWPLNGSQQDVANAFFHFRHGSNVTGSKILMTYSYETLADQVLPADLATYDTALRKLKDGLGYSFTYSTPKQLEAASQKDPNSGRGQFNWPIALLLGFIIATAIPLGIRYCRTSRLAVPLPPSIGSLDGLGGWLVLVALGLIIRPVGFIHANVQISPAIFQLERWRALTDAGMASFHPFWMPTLLFEFIYNSLAFVFSIVLLVLFFQKRAAWSRCFIIFIVVMIVGLAVDYSLGMQIPAAAAGLAGSAKELFRVVFSAAIWIPYCLVSKRVKATFRY